MPTKLCVGLNKIALLRSSRGRDRPSLTEVAAALIEGGCGAILVHTWPDSRHVRLEDVEALAQLGPIARGLADLYVGSDPRAEVVDLIRRTPAVRALIVTPFEARHLTTQRGFGPGDDRGALAATIAALGGGRVSVFVDPAPAGVRFAAAAGAAAVELNCRDYVEHWGGGGEAAALAALAEAAVLARSLGLAVHAAHDLDARHLPALVRAARPDKVSVGHHFIADAVLAGARAALPRYLEAVSTDDR